MKKKTYTAPTSIEVFFEGKESICQTSSVGVDTDHKLGDYDTYDASSRRDIRGAAWSDYEQ